MTLYEALLIAHVLAVTIWLGGSLVILLLWRRALATTDPVAVGMQAATGLWFDRRLVIPSSLVVLLAGGWLMNEGSWGMDQGWLHVGMAAVFAAGEPAPDFRLLDRFLVLAELNEAFVAPAVCPLIDEARLDSLVTTNRALYELPEPAIDETASTRKVTSRRLSNAEPLPLGRTLKPAQASSTSSGRPGK